MNAIAEMINTGINAAEKFIGAPLIASFRKEQEAIEVFTGKSLEVLKKEWLDKLGIAK